MPDPADCRAAVFCHVADFPHVGNNANVIHHHMRYDLHLDGNGGKCFENRCVLAFKSVLRVAYNMYSIKFDGWRR